MFIISMYFEKDIENILEVINSVVEQFKEYNLWERLTRFKKMCKEIYDKMFEVYKYGFKIPDFKFVNQGENGLFLYVEVWGEHEVGEWIYKMHDTIVIGYDIRNDTMIVESWMGCEKKIEEKECGVTYKFMETLNKIGVLDLLAEANVLLKEILEVFKEAKIKVHVD